MKAVWMPGTGKGGGAELLSENGVSAAELEKCHQTKGIELVLKGRVSWAITSAKEGM